MGYRPALLPLRDKIIKKELHVATKNCSLFVFCELQTMSFIAHGAAMAASFEANLATDIVKLTLPPLNTKVEYYADWALRMELLLKGVQYIDAIKQPRSRENDPLFSLIFFSIRNNYGINDQKNQ